MRAFPLTGCAAFGWTLNLSELSVSAWLWLMADSPSGAAMSLKPNLSMVAPLLRPGMGTRKLRNIREHGTEF